MDTKKTKAPIRIIKREERSQREQVIKSQKDKKTPQDTAREMVSTVTSWVSDLQQRHRDDAKRAFKNLFPETTPQVN